MAVRSSSAALKKKIQRLATRTDDGSLELAEALCDARALPKTTQGGRPTITELVELTGQSKRTVCYLLAVWLRFREVDIPRDQLTRIGWKKLAVVAEQCEPGNELQALEIAETCTAKELPARLQGDSETKKKRTVLLRLDARQYKVFEGVLLANGAKHPKKGKKGWGLAGKEAALTRALRLLRAA